MKTMVGQIRWVDGMPAATPVAKGTSRRHQAPCSRGTIKARLRAWGMEGAMLGSSAISYQREGYPRVMSTASKKAVRKITFMDVLFFAIARLNSRGFAN